MTDGGRDLIIPELGDDKEIPEELQKLIESVGKKGLNQLYAYVEMHSGPLPSPRTLAQYREVLEDAPDRIITMAEKEQAHNHEIETRIVQGDTSRANWGLACGFILFLILIGGSIYFLSIGKDIPGYSFLASTIVGGIANFIRVGRERKEEKPKESKPKKRRKPRKKKAK